MRTWRQADPRGEMARYLLPYRDRLDGVNVDANGIGYGFALHLQDLGYPVTQVNVGMGARNPERFANLKAEHYWGLRERLQTGRVAGAFDETTIAQLASIRYRLNPRGQVAIESKEEARKRGVESLDRAEATMLAFISPDGPAALAGYFRQPATTAPTTAQILATMPGLPDSIHRHFANAPQQGYQGTGPSMIEIFKRSRRRYFPDEDV
jgi:hypothetical protein